MSSGAAPVMELGELNSEVHHLGIRMQEHRDDTHERFNKIESSVTKLVERISVTSSDVKHLARVIVWVGGVVGTVLAGFLIAVAVKVLK